MCGGIYQGSNTTFTIIGGVWLLVIEWCHTIQEWNETCIYLKIEGIAGPDIVSYDSLFKQEDVI